MEDAAKTSGGETQISPSEQTPNLHFDDDSFVWDQNSQLYFHPRSGFYHDPNAGWYYSTSDGLYYKFEDGNYILLDSNKECQSVISGQGNCAVDESSDHAMCGLEYDQDKQENKDHIECSNNEAPENHIPPSEWLEDTLIELYLSGYSTAASNADEPLLPYGQEEDVNGSRLSTDASDADTHYVQRDDELSSDHQTLTTLSANEFGEDISWEEESWRAQYGQVVQQEDELRPECLVVDIWDWSMDKKIQKDGISVVASLIGMLVKPSSSLHPSIASRGRRLKTAPICKVHLDLVQVRSGQVYRLKSPNAAYLSTLSSYDASNPTKEWGFPELSNEETKERRESETSFHLPSRQIETSRLDRPSSNKKLKTHTYRDRAAERRSFHKEFGVTLEEESADEMAPDSIEEAAAEALEMSLGAGSYAQKILKNMGWKQGEGLGKTQQGLKEPLQGTGNKGTAGLGWPSGRSI